MKSKNGAMLSVRAWMWSFPFRAFTDFYDERASRRSRLSPYLEIENLSETFNNIHTRFDMLFQRTGDQVVEIIQVTKLTLASRIQMKPLAPFPSAYLTSGSTSLGGFYTTCQSFVHSLSYANKFTLSPRVSLT